jgi:hypothetical protein
LRELSVGPVLYSGLAQSRLSAPSPKAEPCFLAEENVMANPTEKEIKKRAYELWEEAGKPEGREDEFWQLAEQELRNEDKSSPTRTPDNL